MDYKQIKLDNERCGHVTKRLNRLGAWKFFQVLYRNDFIRIMLFNLLLLVFVVPTLIIFYFNQMNLTSAMSTLPYSNVFGIGNSVWLGTTDFMANQSSVLNNQFHLWITLTLLALAFVFSGGYAVVRDSFWTGKFVVIKPFFKGIATNIPYTLGGTAILSATYYGIYTLQTLMLNSASFPNWLAIVLMVLMYMVLAFMALYMFILFSVTTTYRQSFVQNLKDSWLLLFMNFVPNLFKFIVTLLPFVLLLFMNSQIISSLVSVFFLMFGMFYFVFVWSVHMMRTFALFHPVTKAEKQKQQAPPKQLAATQPE